MQKIAAGASAAIPISAFSCTWDLLLLFVLLKLLATLSLVVVQYRPLAISGNVILLSVVEKASPHFSFVEKCLRQQIASQNLQSQKVAIEDEQNLGG